MTTQNNIIGNELPDKRKFVIYNGREVHPDWPAEVEEAQKITHYTINDEDYERVRYGDEEDYWGADEQPCGDCAVLKGQFHVPGCDIECCPVCGLQVLDCDCGD